MPLASPLAELASQDRLASLTRTDIGEASQQAAMLDCVERRYYQTASGSYHGRFERFAVSGLSFCRESQCRSIMRLVAMPDDLVTLFLPSDRSAMRVGVRELGPGTVAFQPGGSQFDVYTRGESEVAFLLVDAQRFRRAALGMDEALWASRLAQGGLLHLHNQDFLRQVVSQALQAAPQWLSTDQNADWQDSLARATLSALLQELGAAADAQEPGGRAFLGHLHAWRMASRARDFIEASVHRRLTVMDVCLELGVSRRTLQDVFHRVLDMNPVAYLRMVRLNRARQELCNPGLPLPTVGEIAARWGFLHPSQFSVDYQRMFGELPSQTLRRSAGLPGVAPRAAALWPAGRAGAHDARGR